MNPGDCQRARLAGSTAAISLAIALSRILGFARDLLIARYFGTGIQAQAFVVAFRLPNLLRDLVAEGAVSSAVVPVLSAARATQAPEQFWRLAQALWCRTVVTVGAVGLAGAAAAPWLVRLIAPGFIAEPDTFALTVALTRVFFPFITLVGLWAFYSGLLNSLHRFALPALGSSVLNLAMIAGCVWLSPRFETPVWGLAYGALLGGALQWLMQLPQAWQLGFRWGWRWSHPGASQASRLLAPRIIGSAVYQLEVFVTTILASLSAVTGVGAVAVLYFANRLIQLPLALFATASSQATLPALSEHAALGDRQAFRSLVVGLLRTVACESLPAAAGLLVLSVPIVQVCFERGAFTAEATTATARTLAVLAVGLGAFAAGKVLTGAFYALHDTRTPVRLAVQALALNVALALALMWPLQVVGLALATVVSSGVNAWRLFRALERRLELPMASELAGPLARMAVAALVMGASCWAAWQALAGVLAPLIRLPLVIVLGIVLYGAVAHAAGVGEVATGLRWVLRQGKPRASATG